MQPRRESARLCEAIRRRFPPVTWETRAASITEKVAIRRTPKVAPRFPGVPCTDRSNRRMVSRSVILAALAAWPAILALGLDSSLAAQQPPMLDCNAVAVCFDSCPLDRLFEVTGGSIGARQEAGETVYCWRPKLGETSVLALRRDCPLFDRLPRFDRLEFEIRIAQGEVSTIGLSALGHVSGPRQYKVHEWSVAARTTRAGVWHDRSCDLACPNWFPFDNPDGEGREGYFRFDVLALAPDTVVELRRLKLVRGLLRLKPDYEMPITWPVKQEAPDGSASYTMTYEVLNASGRPAEIVAAVLSRHKRFQVSFEPTRLPAKSARTVNFTLTASMTARDVQESPLLYAEPLRISFAPADIPEAACTWSGELVRPLPPGIRRQVVVAPSDLETVRRELEAKNKAVADLVGLQKTLAKADEFLQKELKHIPAGHQWPGTNYPPGWRVGSVMPEVENTLTGQRQWGTDMAGLVWKKYLAYPGDMCDHLGMAYLLTGEEKYARKAMELFRLYAEQYAEQPWGRPFELPWLAGVPTLGASRCSSTSTYGSNWYFKGFCRLLSMTADSPAWSKDDRETVYKGFVLPYATELMKFRGGISNMTDITNHNVLLLGLVFDDAHLVRWATLRDVGLLERLRDIDEDGFSSEGRPINYHLAAMTEYLPSLVYLENSGLKIDYPRQRLLAALRMPYLRAALTGRIPSTGDCGRGQAIGAMAHADQLIRLFPQQRWLLEVGTAGTLQAKLLRWKSGANPEPTAWRKLLDTQPRLFPEAGLAILRSGDTPESQIMVTLDYGRNVFHAALDRQQITLLAFGRVFSHGPGSLYNVGSGGMTRGQDKRLDAFCSHGSLGQNVVLVDQQDQLPAVGRLLAWSPKPERQVAASRVDGIQPNVSHTRAVVLAEGVVVIFDRMESGESHVYDFVYHNLGKLSPGPGWTAAAAARPLGTTAGYETIVDLKRLSGAGPIRLAWDLTGETPARQPAAKGRAAPQVPGAYLDLWQLPVAGGEVYTGLTGMNNPNTATMPDAAPSLFHRVRGAGAVFVTVLAPHQGNSPVAGVSAEGQVGVVVSLRDGRKLTLSLDELLKKQG